MISFRLALHLSQWVVWTPLLQTLKGLEEKGVKGQILTTNYLNFSEPRALGKLNGLKNITLKMHDVEAAGNGFIRRDIFSKKKRFTVSSLEALI
ncbi:MAG: hypothetical protein ACLU00_07270 [Mediterraneibacter faecis]